MHRYVLAVALSVSAQIASAEVTVGITSEIASVPVETRSGTVNIERNQDIGNRLDGDWTLTSRPCPNFCIQPMSPAEGVSTIAELELMDMLQDPEAIVVDSRTRDWFDGGTIPGAISIPYTFIIDELGQLGCEPDFDGWICEDVKDVALFCNGSWCGQSPTAIRNMLEAGYPAKNIFYYRGGMQAWRMLGLTVVGGE